MDKAGIITVVSQHQKSIDAAKEKGQEVRVSEFGRMLLERTQEALENGKGL